MVQAEWGLPSGAPVVGELPLPSVCVGHSQARKAGTGERGGIDLLAHYRSFGTFMLKFPSVPVT